MNTEVINYDLDLLASSQGPDGRQLMKLPQNPYSEAKSLMKRTKTQNLHTRAQLKGLLVKTPIPAPNINYETSASQPKPNMKSIKSQHQTDSSKKLLVTGNQYRTDAFMTPYNMSNREHRPVPQGSIHHSGDAMGVLGARVRSGLGIANSISSS